MFKYAEVYITLGSSSEIDYLGFESDRPRYYGAYNTQNYELTFSGIQSSADVELQPSEGVGAYYQGYIGSSDDLYYPEIGIWASMLPKSYRAKIGHINPTDPINIINMATPDANQGFESNFVTLEQGGNYSLDLGAVGLSQEFGGYLIAEPLMLDIYWEEQGDATFNLGYEQVNFGSYTELNLDLTIFSGSNGKLIIYPEMTGFLQEATNSTVTRDVFVHFGDISISRRASVESIVKSEYLPATELIDSSGVSITSGEIVYDDVNDYAVYHYQGAEGDDINRLMLLVSSSSVDDYFEFDAAGGFKLGRADGKDISIYPINDAEFMVKLPGADDVDDPIRIKFGGSAAMYPRPNVVYKFDGVSGTGTFSIQNGHYGLVVDDIDPSSIDDLGLKAFLENNQNNVLTGTAATDTKVYFDQTIEAKFNKYNEDILYSSDKFNKASDDYIKVINADPSVKWDYKGHFAIADWQMIFPQVLING